MDIIHAGICDVGKKRKMNQDSILMLADKERRIYLYIVADGMGGHTDGEVASKAVVEGMKDWWATLNPAVYGDDFSRILLSLQNKLQEINSHIFRKYAGKALCGSTCVCLFAYRNRYAIVSVGDSRIYRKRGFRVKQMTTDDVWENQRQIQETLSLQERKEHTNYGKLVSAVGVSEQLYLTVETDCIEKGDTFLLCSDGLYKYCNETKMLQSIRRATRKNLEEKVQKLKEMVYQEGAFDNISIILVKCVE